MWTIIIVSYALLELLWGILPLKRVLRVIVQLVLLAQGWMFSRTKIYLPNTICYCISNGNVFIMSEYHLMDKIKKFN